MHNEINSYLEKIDGYLKRLPVIERTDIIKEIQSAIVEMQSDGLSDSQIIERLGNPKDLAAAYYGEVLTKDNSLSFGRFWQVIGFYSLIGLTGVIVIPTLAIVSVTFIFCGWLVGVIGIVDLVLKTFNVKIPWVLVNFAGYSPTPIVATLICVVVGVLLVIAGKAAWKSLLKYISYVSTRHQKLNNEF